LTPSTYGQSITFTATVAPTPTGGTVQFYENGIALGAPATVSGGTAFYSTSALAVGSYQITAQYGGTTFYASSSTASASSQQVTAASLAIAANPQSKVYGTLLVFGGGNTNFSSTGLQNGETIGSVTLAVSGNGGATNAPVGSYTITPSLATGGTFAAANYSIAYQTNSLTVTLPPNSIPVTIVDILRQADGTMHLDFSGTPGYVYMIEATTNLTPTIVWTVLGTNAADTNGLFNFTDLQATNYSSRFYQTATQ
jgi:Bacterial Ig-like domain (group 3)/MBG domain (YGX type)